MRIVPIFADQLFAFRYKNEKINEFDRLIELWTDVEFLKDYAKANGVIDQISLVNNILADVEQIEDILDEIGSGKRQLEHFFRPLNDNEYDVKVLSRQKGKVKKSTLRIYALKIDTNLFVITGGAIKLDDNWQMKDHDDTQQELAKLEAARNFLKENDVFDEDSFYELLDEN